MIDLIEYQKSLERKKGHRDRLNIQMDSTKKRVLHWRKRTKHIEQAQIILQETAKQTQEQLEYKISELATLALSNIFDDPYEMKLKFEIKRDKTEAKIVLCQDELEINPMDAAGGGVVDILSFSLKLAVWQITKSRTAPILILDEPFRFLSEDLRPMAGNLLKMVSEKLGMQIIMVTHDPNLVESADRVFRVKKENGISEVIWS
ncbi:MAG: hypothetical protein ACTSYH_03650 [Candidatus Heimdallarchaeaceae archaeon]